MYSSKKTNPFLDDDDETDSFSDHRRYGEPTTDFQGGRRRQLVQEIDESENRQLASTQRALQSLCESERMGVATAEVELYIYFFPQCLMCIYGNILIQPPPPL